MVNVLCILSQILVDVVTKPSLKHQRDLYHQLNDLTSTSSPTSKTSETLAVRDHEISEM